MTRAGFPHSEIRASKPACGSTRLIAACHVLHRLPVPRHPPYALTILMVWIRAMQFSKTRRLRSRGRLKKEWPYATPATPEPKKALKTEQQLLESGGTNPPPRPVEVS